jgi:hypothetical protein
MEDSMATQRKSATTIRLTRRTYDALVRRAQRAGRDADALAEEMLQVAIAQEPPAQPETEREMIRRVLREGGLILRDGSEYGVDLDPNVDYEALRRELASIHLDPPLSQTIIEERHRK